MWYLPCLSSKFRSEDGQMKTTFALLSIISLAMPTMLTGAVDENGEFISFIRGDADHNDVVDITDAILIVRAICGYGHEKLEGCFDAADPDDDGGITYTDAIYLLNYLFGNGPPPKWPFPDPGVDPLPYDGLGCGWAG